MDSSGLVESCSLTNMDGESRASRVAEACEDSGSESEGEQWEKVEEEEISLAQQTLCIFCDEVFSSTELMFDHSHSQHMFDIVLYSKKMGLNCISYIKFINYIRTHKLSSSELNGISKLNCPWTQDEFMKPYNPADPLLTFDIESYVREKIANRADCDEMITISHSKFEAILQKLAYKEMKLQNAYDRIDRMKEAAKTVLLCNNQECSSVNKRQSSQDNNSLSKDDEDNYYFSTYDHFNIHHEMLQDKARTGAYQEAILKNPEVFQNKRVLDVGCGTAILSMFAAQAGASHVMAVDKSDVIFQAMDIVRENNFENVIDLFKGRVEDVPEPEAHVDIIISEWMGYFLLFEGMLDSVLYARDKFLTPGGLIFPNRCTLSLVAVCDMERYKEYVSFWDNVYGFKMTVMKTSVIKEANIENIKPEVLCSEPVVVKELNLNQCQVSDTEFASNFNLVMNRTCEVTAVVGYFDCFFDKNLAHEVILSTSPKAPSTHWRQTMFLLSTPVPVAENEVVSCRVSLRKNRRDPRSIIVKLNFGNYQNEYYLS